MGRIFKFDKDVDTDQIIASQYLLFPTIADVRCFRFTLPALLPAVFREHTGVGQVIQARHAMVHDVVDFPAFPLLRLVKGVVQGFLEKLLGTHPVSYTHLDVYKRQGLG